MKDEADGNVLSCVVYVHHGAGTDVAERINQWPGTQVHAGVAEDRLVVTIEDTPASKAADLLAELNGIQGVINTLLIYHCEVGAAA